jgi:hypothetical protein
MGGEILLFHQHDEVWARLTPFGIWHPSDFTRWMASWWLSHTLPCCSNWSGSGRGAVLDALVHTLFCFFVKEVEIFKDFTRWMASWWLSQSLLCCSNWSGSGTGAVLDALLHTIFFLFGKECWNFQWFHPMDDLMVAVPPLFSVAAAETKFV